MKRPPVHSRNETGVVSLKVASERMCIKHFCQMAPIRTCAAFLPTPCHIVIVHVHAGDPECHVGMISPHLFGFRNHSSVLVKALAKHRPLCRSEADSRYVVTKTKKIHMLFKHREQNVLSNMPQKKDM